MNIAELTRPLTIDEIDFRVQSVNNGGYATILAYKDARADMKRLDAAVGPLGWKREHSNSNANCTVSIWNPEIKEWVSKEDTGTEANTEKEKSIASDSFKRSCFAWGIGRELYDYPVISVKLFDSEITEKNGRKTASWGLKLKEWTWFSQFDDNGKLSYLAAKDQNNKKRFVWGEFNPDLKQQEVSGVKADSSPSEDPTVRGTSDEEEKGNVEAMKKQEAEPIEQESPTEEQKAQPTEEEVKWNELAQKYEIMFGKKPRANTKLETLEQKIAEETARREAEKQEETTSSAVYSASGDEADEEDDTPQPVDDAYSEDETTMTEQQLEKAEEEQSMLQTYIDEIETFNDRSEFVEWAKEVVLHLTRKVTEEELVNFRNMCNEHYAKIG
jgi:hypothetical protein